MAAIRPSGALEAGKMAEHGRRIFIYRHIRSNRIIYSLTRAMNNTQALKQMYFLGKKTVGNPQLRKDVWTPFATVSFPTGFQGLAAFQQLREYAKRHLMEWTVEEIRERMKFDGVGELMTPLQVKERHEKARLNRNEITVTVKRRKTDRKWLRQELGPALTDQKANSVADLARVMEHQTEASAAAAKEDTHERELNEAGLSKAEKRLAELLATRKELEGKEDVESRLRYHAAKTEKMRLQKAMKQPMPWAALRGKYHMMNDRRPAAKRGYLKRLNQRDLPRFTMKGVKIEWANMFDKSFAQSWPDIVEHSEMLTGGNYWRNTATTAFNPPVEEDALLEQEAREMEAKPQPTLSEPEIRQTALDKLISRLKFGSDPTAASRNISAS